MWSIHLEQGERRCRLLPAGAWRRATPRRCGRQDDLREACPRRRPQPLPCLPCRDQAFGREVDLQRLQGRASPLRHGRADRVRDLKVTGTGFSTANSRRDKRSPAPAAALQEVRLESRGQPVFGSQAQDLGGASRPQPRRPLVNPNPPRLSSGANRPASERTGSVGPPGGSLERRDVRPPRSGSWRR